MFEVLLDYKGLGKLRIELEQLRKLLGIEDHQYSVFAMFRKKVLDMAMREINKMTELEVFYETEKTGKRYSAIIFYITGTITEQTKKAVQSQIVNKLNFYGFNAEQIKELLQKHDEDYILANIAVVEEDLEKGRKIKNVKSYLAKGFKVNYSHKDSEYERQLQQKQQAKQKALLKTEENKKQATILRKGFEEERKQQVKSVLQELSEEEISKLKENFVSNILQNAIFEKMYQSKGFQSPMIQIQRFIFLAKKFLPESYHSFEQYSV